MSASILRLYCCCALFAGVALAQDAPPLYKLPLFRTIDVAIKPPALAADTKLRLLADRDFAPFSFATSSGEAAGLAVEVALAGCAELKVACEVALLPFGELLRALAEERGEAVISGPRVDEKALENAVATRPYFRTLGRFAVQSGNPITASDAASLKGKRIGMAKGTAHAAWLAAYYGDAELVAFDSEALAQDALRTGGIEALFGDALRVIYWVEGTKSAGCCKLLGAAYVDRDYFSRSLVFLIRANQVQLRDAFDYALDRLQQNGTTEKIFTRYVPLSPW